MVTDTWFYFLSCFFLLTRRDFIFGMSSSKHHVLGVSQNPVLNHYFWKPLQALSIHERNWPPLGLVLFIMMYDLRHVMYPIGIQSKILIGKYTWGFLRFYMQQPIFHTGNASYACHLLCPQLPHFLADSPSYYLSLFPHPPYSQPPVLIFPSSLLLSSPVEHFPSILFNSLHILCFVCCHIFDWFYDLLLSLVQQWLIGSQSQNVSSH